MVRTPWVFPSSKTATPCPSGRGASRENVKPPAGWLRLQEAAGDTAGWPPGAACSGSGVLLAGQMPEQVPSSRLLVINTPLSLCVSPWVVPGCRGPGLPALHASHARERHSGLQVCLQLLTLLPYKAYVCAQNVKLCFTPPHTFWIVFCQSTQLQTKITEIIYWHQSRTFELPNTTEKFGKPYRVTTL